MTDLEIIEAIKNKRNDKAFGALYKNFPAIRKMIISNNGLKEDAEDIFQESLIILCSKVNDGNFTLTSQLGTFLYSVSRFLWNDELKRRGRRNDILTEVDLFENTSLTEAAMDEEYKAKLAEKTMDTLGERCKELLLLFYTKSMKLNHIAAKMGYNSENTAKNQKYKCLEMAKKNLKELQQNSTVNKIQ
jgi:RNA polymerase sigma factor (sigma-70 family)